MSQFPQHGQTQGTVTFDYNGVPVVLEILDLNWKKIERESIEVTNQRVKPTAIGTGRFGNKMKIPSIYVDPGQLPLRVQHNAAAPIPIVEQDLVLFAIKLGGFVSSQEEFQCLGFVQAYEMIGPMDGKVVQADIVIELSDVVDPTDPSIYDDTGAVEWTAAS